MKNVIKFGLVGLIGYTIGFYEMKYKVMKIILNAKLEEQNDQNEEEAQ